MFTKEKLEKYLERCLKTGADFAELFIEKSNNTNYSYIDSKVNKNKTFYNCNPYFKKKDGKAVAIYKDDKGVEHIIYNRCPHLKCSLVFNEVEKTWDCPCHGSRFDLDGKCIMGPSNYDIGYK